MTTGYSSILSMLILVLAITITVTPFLIIKNTYATTAMNYTIYDPLPSWNEGKAKQTIINFVQNITDPTNANYVPPGKRIATFDSDGTLISEKPIPFDGYFAVDTVPDLVAKKPELKQISPFKEILEKNFTALRNMTSNNGGGEPIEVLQSKDIMDLMLMTHSNISQTEFDSLVYQWVQTDKHPITKRPFVEMVYQPMLELLNFLKVNQFKNFIVSGSSIDFMRQALSSVYGIPPEQIIGSSGKYKFVDNNDTNTNNSFIFREPELNSYDSGSEKPVNMQLHIGRIPVIAGGNSDGDLKMLKYVDDNNNNNKDGKALILLVHHDDPTREYSYDKGAENVLQEAQNRNWTLVSMKDDFREIYANVTG